MVRLLAWAMACVLPALVSAHAGDRSGCDLNARKVSGTYGFAAQGTATGSNPFAPVGPFAQSGTVTLTAQGETARAVTGRWVATLAQNDADGYKPGVTFGGTFTTDKSTCGGDFSVTSPAGSVLAFRVIFVAGGREVRTISAIPNLIVAYSTAKRL
jgi:hypothetical protein